MDSVDSVDSVRAESWFSIFDMFGCSSCPGQEGKVGGESERLRSGHDVKCRQMISGYFGGSASHSFALSPRVTCCM